MLLLRLVLIPYPVSLGVLNGVSLNVLGCVAIEFTRAGVTVDVLCEGGCEVLEERGFPGALER